MVGGLSMAEQRELQRQQVGVHSSFGAGWAGMCCQCPSEKGGRHGLMSQWAAAHSTSISLTGDTKIRIHLPACCLQAVAPEVKTHEQQHRPQASITRAARQTFARQPPPAPANTRDAHFCLLPLSLARLSRLPLWTHNCGSADGDLPAPASNQPTPFPFACVGL